ncbi:MAG: protein kinase [Candidatus Binatus sp.]|uniref:protein kinase domain-containing protein n=1 Tax=Candidatus Binatus sp. TaxID=2811406 RepID=UPI0027218BF5|nr:protein kinase [Candidatus Binatus sp.]MDO8433850.1 protein kinase [Candidatus Binatus sp.]
MLKSLNEGGQGHIFLVRDAGKNSESLFVLKRLKNAGRLDLFEREVNATRSINHTNILRVVDFDLAGAQPYYVAEYCERGSLVDIGATAFKGNVTGAVSVLGPIVDALHAAHERGIFHRDVKPPNILIRQDGQPVLADFGICHVEGDTRFTLATNEPGGSVNYVAPEMESGRRLGPPCAETDAYSIGKVLYWMLSGGDIFAREDHRGRPLTEILGEQHFEHVHLFLDEAIVEKPENRIRFAELANRIKQMEALVMGNFTPLKPSMALTCRFCGLGKYERHVGPDAGNISRIGIPQMANKDMRALRCDHCGHVELFDFLGLKNDWWSR